MSGMRHGAEGFWWVCSSEFCFQRYQFKDSGLKAAHETESHVRWVQTGNVCGPLRALSESQSTAAGRHAVGICGLAVACLDGLHAACSCGLMVAGSGAEWAELAS